MMINILRNFAFVGLSLILFGCNITGDKFGSLKPYPLDVCIVSDNELGSMGDPVPYNHQGQQIKFCCKPRIKKFKANPDKYLAKLKHANPVEQLPEK